MRRPSLSSRSNQLSARVGAIVTAGALLASPNGLRADQGVSLAAAATAFCRTAGSTDGASGRTTLDIGVPVAGTFDDLAVERREPNETLPARGPLAAPFGVWRSVLSTETAKPGTDLQMEIGVGADVEDIDVDFAALDSGYRAGAEQVQKVRADLYRVRYVVSSTNGRSPGAYAVDVVLHGRGRTARQRVATIDYSRTGRGSVELVDGRFQPAPFIPKQAAGGLQILSVTLDGGTADTGLTYLVNLSGPADLRWDDLEVRLREPGFDGYWQAPLRTREVARDGRVSRVRGTFTLGMSYSFAGVPAPALDLQVVGGGAASGDAVGRLLVGSDAGIWTAVASAPNGRLYLGTDTGVYQGQTGARGPGDKVQGPGFEPTHRIGGRIRFEYERHGPDILGSLGNADFPQYADLTSTVQVKAARFATVVLHDDCGTTLKSRTDAEGYFSFAYAPAGCFLGTITAWSVVETPTRQAAVGRWKGAPLASYNDLSTNASDYAAHGYQQGFVVAGGELPDGLDLDIVMPDTTTAARAFYILDNVVAAQDYFDDIAGVNGLPKLNVVYSPGLKPEGMAYADWDGGYAVYMPSKDPGMIVIPDEPSDMGFNRFAHQHEVAHYFQKHYLRDMDYGKIGEPLANAHAAAIAGSPWFDKVSVMESLDVQANYKDGAFRQASWAFCDGCDPGAGEADLGAVVADFTQASYSYGWTQRVLWDLIDPTSTTTSEPLTAYVPDGAENPMDFGQFDLDAGGGGQGISTDADNHQINDVLVNYLGGGWLGTPSASYVDRGLVHVDLADVLDGMLCRGKASANAIDQLVNHAMGFGYDFGGPAGCP